MAITRELRASRQDLRTYRALWGSGASSKGVLFAYVTPRAGNRDGGRSIGSLITSCERRTLSNDPKPCAPVRTYAGGVLPLCLEASVGLSVTGTVGADYLRADEPGN